MGGQGSWLAQACGAWHPWPSQAWLGLRPKFPTYPGMHQWVVARQHIHGCRCFKCRKARWRPHCQQCTSHGCASSGCHGQCHRGVTGLGWGPESHTPIAMRGLMSGPCASTSVAQGVAEAAKADLVRFSNLWRTPAISSLGHSMAALGGLRIPKATPCTSEAYWVKLALVRLVPWSPSRGHTSGGGGRTTIRELTLRALFSASLRPEPTNGDSKSVTYLLAPCV